MIQEFYPGEEDGGLRIDKYLSQAAEGLSRSYIQKLLKEGKVMADGRPVKASFQVEEDIRITLALPEAVQPHIAPKPMELDLLY